MIEEFKLGIKTAMEAISFAIGILLPFTVLFFLLVKIIGVLVE